MDGRAFRLARGINRAGSGPALAEMAHKLGEIVREFPQQHSGTAVEKFSGLIARFGR
jgi:hypothetical protein